MVLKFKFKGNRDYIHGTDMVDKLLDVYDYVSNYSIQIKKMTSKNLKIKKKASDGFIVATMTMNKRLGSKKKIYLVESNTSVTDRYLYNEESILSNARIDNNEESITSYLNDSYTLTENLVALHKKLVQQVVSTDVKWLFVGMDLKEVVKFSASDEVKIQIRNKLSTKLIKSYISINNSNIGFIKFSSI